MAGGRVTSPSTERKVPEMGSRSFIAEIPLCWVRKRTWSPDICSSSCWFLAPPAPPEDASHRRAVGSCSKPLSLLPRVERMSREVWPQLALAASRVPCQLCISGKQKASAFQKGCPHQNGLPAPQLLQHPSSGSAPPPVSHPSAAASTTQLLTHQWVGLNDLRGLFQP